MRFIDTNVLLYSVSTDPRDAAKRPVAEELLRSQDLALSVQVLQEFHAQATRPTRFGTLQHEQAATIIASLKRFPILDNTVEVFESALTIRGRWPLSIWDAMIIASAAKLGCGQVLTEDMQDGAVIAGVRVVNPFG
ncbi:MAG: PIN domain-containing protein [Beijerinckiaceae bacterium]